MTDRSLLEAARIRHPTLTDEQLMVLVAADLLDEIALEPPVDPTLVASWRGISRVELCDIPWAGCLLAENGDLVIKVRRDDPAPRRRFTVFHEIAHTFLPGFHSTTRYRCSPGATRQRSREEKLCDVAASELLLPTPCVRDRLFDRGLCFEFAEELASDFGASLEASCRRIVTLWPLPSLLIAFELRTAPRQRAGSEPRLRVTSRHINGPWPFLPIHKSLPPSHAVYGVFSSGRLRCKTDLDDLWNDRIGALEVDARHSPWTDNDGVHHDRVLLLAAGLPMMLQ